MKRFSETGRFDEEWFMELSVEFKMAWEYVWAKCDNAGVWKPNKKLADFTLGKKIVWEDLQHQLEEADKITTLDNGDWLITRFIDFQCGELSAACRPHSKVFELLKKHGIEYVGGQLFGKRSRRSTVTPARRKLVFERDGNACVYCGSTESLQPDHIHPRKLQGSCKLSNLLTACCACNNAKSDKTLIQFLENKDYRERVIGYVDSLSETSDRLQYTDKEEEEDSGVGKGSGERKGTPKNPKRDRRRGTLEEIIAFCESNGLPASDGQACFDKWEGNGWKNGGAPIADWQATIRSWKAHGYLPSQKGAGNGSAPPRTNGHAARPPMPQKGEHF